MDRNTHFQWELQKLVNQFGIDNDCNTPDFVLAEYLVNCLDSLQKRNDGCRIFKLDSFEPDPPGK